MVLCRETVRAVTEPCTKSNIRLFKTPPPYPLFLPLAPLPFPASLPPSPPSMLSTFSTLLSSFYSSYVQFGSEMTPVPPPLPTSHISPSPTSPPSPSLSCYCLPAPPPTFPPLYPSQLPSPYFSLPTMGESPMMTEARALFTCWLASVVSCWMHGKIWVRMASTW